MSTETSATVLHILRGCAGIPRNLSDEAVLASTLEDLDVDSLARLEFSCKLELEYGAEFPETEIAEMRTPAHVVAHVNTVIGGSGQAGGDGAPVEKSTDAGELGEAQTDSTVLIAAPMDLVWDMTNDLVRWPDLFDEYSRVEILEHDETRFLFRLTMHPGPDGTSWSWVSERVLDPADRVVRARRIETGWFTFMTLRWDYQQTPSGVNLRWRQWFDMRSDSPVVRQQMIDRIQSSSRVQMERIKAIVEAAAGHREHSESLRAG